MPLLGQRGGRTVRSRSVSADRRIVVPVDFWARYSAEEQALPSPMSFIITGAATFSPTTSRCLCWRSTGSIRSRGRPSVPSAPEPELSCDAAVAAAAPGSNTAYANALVKSASPDPA